MKLMKTLLRARNIHAISLCNDWLQKCVASNNEEQRVRTVEISPNQENLSQSIWLGSRVWGRTSFLFPGLESLLSTAPPYPERRPRVRYGRKLVRKREKRNSSQRASFVTIPPYFSYVTLFFKKNILPLHLVKEHRVLRKLQPGKYWTRNRLTL